MRRPCDRCWPRTWSTTYRAQPDGGRVPRSGRGAGPLGPTESLLGRANLPPGAARHGRRRSGCRAAGERAATDSQTLNWRAANVYQVRDGQVVDCRVFIEDLYAFDQFWAGMPNRAAPTLTEVGETRMPTGAAVTAVTDPRAVAARWTQALTAHDLEAAVACFAPDYRDGAPARRGEFVQGNQKVRENFDTLFREIPDLRAELLRSVADGDTVWMEWRMHGTRRDGTPLELAGVNLFGVQDEQFGWGRISTELVRDASSIDAQIERMTKG